MSGHNSANRWRLGEILIQKGWLSWDNLEKALSFQQEAQRTQQWNRLSSEIPVPQWCGQESRLHLGEILVQEGWIDWPQLNECLEIQDTQGHFLGEILVEKGYVTKTNLYRGLAKQCKVPFMSIHRFTIASHILCLIPKWLAYKFKVVPVMKEDHMLLVASSDVRDPIMKMEVSDFLRTYDVHLALSCPEEIQWALDFYYGPRE